MKREGIKMTGQTADEIAKKWANGLGSATAAIKAGVQNTTIAPGQAAARSKELWASRVAESKDKWATNVAKVSLNDWQDSMINKGIGRIASGANAATNKFGAFMGKLLPYEQAAVASLPERGTLEQNIDRATTMMRKMAAFKK
jgi:hypothetical protein